jgi:hypothetical protein
VIKAKPFLNFEDIFTEEFTPVTIDIPIYGADPLLLSVISKRVNIKNNVIFNVGWSKENVQQILDKVTPEDITLTNDIRSYYTNKYMMIMLAGKKLSEFKAATVKALAIIDGQETFPDKFIPIYYKLPEFYEYDRVIESIFKQFPDHDTSTKAMRSLLDKDELRLNFITKLVPGSKRLPQDQYWFNDDVGNIFLIKIAKPNNLTAFWDEYLTKYKTIKIIEPSLRLANINGHQHYTITNTEIGL